MSYQRAVVNCRKCYELASPRANDRAFPNASEESLRRDLNLHNIRDRAIKALEDEARSPIADKEKTYVFERADCLRENIRRALTACMNCDYKEARIAEIFDPSDGSV
jgi:hypothetical protein